MCRPAYGSSCSGGNFSWFSKKVLSSQGMSGRFVSAGCIADLPQRRRWIGPGIYPTRFTVPFRVAARRIFAISILRHRRVDPIRPRQDAALEVLQLREALFAEKLD